MSRLTRTAVTLDYGNVEFTIAAPNLSQLREALRLLYIRDKVNLSKAERIAIRREPKRDYHKNTTP